MWVMEPVDLILLPNCHAIFVTNSSGPGPADGEVLFGAGTAGCSIITNTLYFLLMKILKIQGAANLQHRPFPLKCISYWGFQTGWDPSWKGDNLIYLDPSCPVLPFFPRFFLPTELLTLKQIFVHRNDTQNVERGNLSSYLPPCGCWQQRYITPGVHPTHERLEHPYISHHSLSGRVS